MSNCNFAFMIKTISKEFKVYQSALDDFILNYDSKGKPFGSQKRNSLRLFQLNDYIVNIKSFKIPNLINQIVYSFFRKSKAQRSFEFAHKLLSLDIGTPKPIAFYEFKSFLLFKKSFYLSEHLECDFTFRDLKHLSKGEYEDILRAFTRFTYRLHEKQVLFLDHSPGNTLIK